MGKLLLPRAKVQAAILLLLTYKEEESASLVPLPEQGGCQQGGAASERMLTRSDPQLGNALCIQHLGESVGKAEWSWQWVAIKYIAAIIAVTVEKAGTGISLREAEEKKYKQNTGST